MYPEDWASPSGLRALTVLTGRHRKGFKIAYIFFSVMKSVGYDISYTEECFMIQFALQCYDIWKKNIPLF